MKSLFYVERYTLVESVVQLASRLVPNGREIHATATGTLGSINVTASQSAPCLVTAPVQQTLVMA